MGVSQADAGTSSGGASELTGGFWFRVVPGDCYAEGVVNLFDFEAFLTCVTGPDGGPVSPDCACFDFNDDDDVDFGDFADLQAAFTG